MSRKHVLIFTETALALSETFIAAHCRSLRAYDFTLVALETSGENHGDVKRTVLFDQSGAKRIEKAAFRLGISSKVDRLIETLRPNIIHAHYLTNGAFIQPYAARHHIPLVATGHGYDVTRRLTRFSAYDTAYRVRRLQLAKHAALILPVSNYLRERILATGFDPRRVRTHYLGTDIPDTPPVSLLASAPRIVFAGRLVEKKGVDRVLEAFALVKVSRPDAELHIVGDGPLRSRVQSQLTSNSGIVYHGALGAEETREVIASARLFTMPSRVAADGDSEGFGLVLVEAQARGVPVVTSQDTGTSEAVEHDVTGFAVDGSSPHELAAAYLRLLNSPALAARMGLEAFAYARERFDIMKQTAKLEAIYDEVVDRSQSGGGI